MKKIFFFFLVFFLFSMNVDASVAKVVVSCPSQSTPSKQVKCSVNLEISGTSADYFEFKINTVFSEPDLSFTDVVGSTSSGSFDNTVQVSGYLNNSVSKTVKIADLVLNIPDKMISTNEKISVSDVVIKSGSKSVVTSTTASDTIKIVGNVSLNSSSKASLKISCPKTMITIKETLTCDLVAIVTNTIVDKLDFTVSGDGGTVSYKTIDGIFSNDSAFSYGGTTIVSYSDAINNSKLGTIGKIQFVPSKLGNQSVVVKNIEFSYGNISKLKYSYSQISKTIVVTSETGPSTINTLSGIKIDGKLISGFNSDKLTYELVNSSSSIKISATKTDSLSTISGDIGTKTLKYGTNIFKIYVTSQSGVKKTYTITITRNDNRSKVNILKSLVLSHGTLNFNPTTKKYDVLVNSNVDKIKITSELSDSKSKYVKNYGNREVSLKYGTNTILIKVQAENGEVNTYTINVTRDDGRSRVNTLKTLELDSGSISFDPSINNYEITVNPNVEKIKITSSLTDDKSKYVKNYGDREVYLLSGKNTILMKVQAENESVNTYTVIVTRLTEEEFRQKDVTINKIVVNGKEISKVNGSYDVLIKEGEILKIDLSLTNINATYEVIGNDNLKDGSIVIIKVISEDKTTMQEYKINVKIKNDVVNSAENNNGVFIISIGFFLFGVLLLSYSVYRRVKK